MQWPHVESSSWVQGRSPGTATRGVVRDGTGWRDGVGEVTGSQVGKVLKSY